MDCSTLGFSVLHHLPKLAQIHIPLSQSIISSSVIPFSSCPQSFPGSGSFLMSQLCTSGGQSIGAWASASVLPVNIQDWFPLGWTGWISLQSKGLSRVFSNTTIQKASVVQCSTFFMVQHSHPYMTTGKTRALMMQTCVREVMSLLFNMLSRSVIAFLSRSKRVYISWLQSSSSVILEPKKIRSVIVFTFSPSSRVLFSELISRFLNWCKCPWNASLSRAAGTEPGCGAHSKPTDSCVTWTGTW